MSFTWVCRAGVDFFSFGLQRFLLLSSAGSNAVLSPGCCWAYLTQFYIHGYTADPWQPAAPTPSYAEHCGTQWWHAITR